MLSDVPPGVYTLVVIKRNHQLYGLPSISVEGDIEKDFFVVKNRSTGRFFAHRPNTIEFRASSLSDSEMGKHVEYNFSTRYKVFDGEDFETYAAYSGRIDFF